MEVKKRVYIGLLAASLLFTAIITGLIWFLFYQRDLLWGQILSIAIISVAVITLTILALGIMAIVMMIIRSKSIPSLESLTLLSNELLFPVTLLIGKLFGIEKEKILGSFIAVNNYLVSSKQIEIPGERIMILAPHCLQNSECPFKITIDVENCKECGKCKIADLKKLAKDYQVSLIVATGGTLARKFIKERQPRAVVAIACERDLSSGIQDMGVLPVMGVLNCRPHGPCINTDVNIEDVKNAVETMCKGGLE